MSQPAPRKILRTPTLPCSKTAPCAHQRQQLSAVRVRQSIRTPTDTPACTKYHAGAGCCLGVLLLGSALMAGCSSAPVAQRDEVFVHIRLVDKIEERPDAQGLANCNNGVCYIQILRNRYPECITHEVRHGFEANWHEHRETTDYCLVQR